MKDVLAGGSWCVLQGDSADLLKELPDASIDAVVTDPPAGIESGQNHHPTVKAIELMQWLCRLVTPPGGIVLDPFCGTGSTGIAALREGFRFIGIEREPEYVEMAKNRIDADCPLFNR